MWEILKEDEVREEIKLHYNLYLRTCDDNKTLPIPYEQYEKEWLKEGEQE